ncbi:hypothetical protein BDP27DRAFT_1441913 [Rhodocollybia butyracea]|uniref:Uncharacterized protein n=1 Tax=Rhodocollybia butyracea TaxID=206335 RepID=A0A9P5Q9J3_9AGAR|nr:hypothetical protein BDP27DRAFT_1441913 [Rhodocollybia butyracea]
MFRLSSINTVVSILFLFQVVVQGMPQPRAEGDTCHTGYPPDCPEGYRCCPWPSANRLEAVSSTLLTFFVLGMRGRIWRGIIC